MRVWPSAVEPAVVPLEEAGVEGLDPEDAGVEILAPEDTGVEELDPQPASNIPANTMRSRMMIKEIIRFFIFSPSSRFELILFYLKFPRIHIHLSLALHRGFLIYWGSVRLH
jgi:hypothetical protein